MKKVFALSIFSIILFTGCIFRWPMHDNSPSSHGGGVGSSQQNHSHQGK